MDKITPVVIAAFVIGLVLGYLLHGGTSTPKSDTSQTSLTSNANASPSTQPGSKEAKIQDALAAAPETLRQNATVMDYPEKPDGPMAELQKGTNGWTCLPDLPSSPGKDPMCLDKTGMEWLDAYVNKKTPSIVQNGIAYMLAGGSDASNTDPFAEKPTEGDDWISTPSHMMILPSQKLDVNVYGTNPKTGGPWIMWAGTPYEHLMVPVK
jgi:hypothetical protein